MFVSEDAFIDRNVDVFLHDPTPTRNWGKGMHGIFDGTRNQALLWAKAELCCCLHL